MALRDLWRVATMNEAPKASRCCQAMDVEPVDGSVTMNPMVYRAEMKVYCSKCGRSGIEVFHSDGYEWEEEA